MKTILIPIKTTTISIKISVIFSVRQLRFDVVLIHLVALRSFTQALLLPESDRTAKVAPPSAPITSPHRFYPEQILPIRVYFVVTEQILFRTASA